MRASSSEYKRDIEMDRAVPQCVYDLHSDNNT